MKTYRSKKGPFKEQPFYSLKEIEAICSDELRKVNLYPKDPGPIRIDRFIEKRFKISPQYEELPEGLLGYSKFGSNGVEEIVVSKSLCEEGTQISERKVNTTLAHEAGHVLLQGHLFVLEQERLLSLFEGDMDSKSPKILCRKPRDQDSQNFVGYDGKWWEYQANQAIGPLLIPRPLAIESVSEFLTSSGTMGNQTLPNSKREEAARKVAEIFDVNPIVARIRLKEIFPMAEQNQLHL